MATLTIPHSFIAGTPALASEVNANFQAIVNWTQSNIGTDNLGILTARSIPLPSSPVYAILSLSQTASQPVISISNQGTDNAFAISQSGVFATGKGAIVINDPTTQTTSGAAHLLMSLSGASTIPAIKVSHGASVTLELTANYLRLETLLKPAVRTTAQRNALVTPEEGSVLYNTDTDELNVKRSDAWMPVGVPVGTIQMYAVDSAPEGWLLCNGQAVSRTTYAKLFDILATTYGSGDGVNTFNIPNLVGVFPRGSQMDGVTTQTIGGETFNAQVRATTQRDSTAVNGLSATTGNPNVSLNHTHAIWGQSGGGGGAAQQETGRNTFDTLGVNGSNPNLLHTHAVTISSTDTETRPANISLAFIIKW
jgi:microcystin-dependent protein